MSRGHRSVLVGAALATVGLLGAILLLGRPLLTAAAPLGIVSLQFATSPETAVGMLDSWRDVPRQRLAWAHGLDLLLPFAYALLFRAAAARLASARPAARNAAVVAAGGGSAAALADQAENVAMAVTLLRGPSWASVLVTLAAAAMKTMLLLLAAGALIAAVLAARRARSPA